MIGLSVLKISYPFLLSILTAPMLPRIFAVSLLLLLVGRPAGANEAPIPLTEAELTSQLADLPGWTVEQGRLRRTYRFNNFVEAIAFVNRLVAPAEAAGHHPDLEISYNLVTISLVAHDIGAISAQDLALARTISALVTETNPEQR